MVPECWRPLANTQDAEHMPRLLASENGPLNSQKLIMRQEAFSGYQ